MLKLYVLSVIIIYVKSDNPVHFLDELEPKQLPLHVGYLQAPFPEVVGFPCLLINVVSDEVPTNVHKLRPGDIDVIAAMGDYFTVGVGSTAQHYKELGLENRGLSFSIGGQWTWRNSTTFPNILKIFNPNLIGYSFADSLPYHNDAQYNVAESGATTSDLVYMAEILVTKIRDDPRVDFNNSWKMVTLAIGGNDMCSQICTIKNPEKFPELYRKRLVAALDFLKMNMPRTFVNLVSVPPLQDTMLYENKPKRCEVMRLKDCPCWAGNLVNRTDANRELYKEIQKKNWQIEKDVTQLYRGDTNFTVVYQPFTEKFTLTTPAGENDFSMVAFDCFHLSQKGNAWAGTALWNNLLEPTGNKSKTWTDPRDKFLCPTDEQPFFHTYDNDHIHLAA